MDKGQQVNSLGQAFNLGSLTELKSESTGVKGRSRALGPRSNRNTKINGSRYRVLEEDREFEVRVGGLGPTTEVEFELSIKSLVEPQSSIARV